MQNYQQHVRRGGAEGKEDLIYQGSKPPTCMEPEKTTNPRRKRVEREGTEGAKETQIGNQQPSVDYRKGENKTPAG